MSGLYWPGGDVRRWDRRVYPPYRLALATAPAEEPVTATEAKAHCRVETTADDTLITSLIVAARGVIETRSNRALVTQTWDLYLDYFPRPRGGYERGVIQIPNPPLVSVTHVKYYAEDGTLTTIDSADYQVCEGTPGRILPTVELDWPSHQDRAEAVTVRYVAGYGGASSVPQTLKQAVLLVVGHLYENRESVVAGMTFTELPFAVDALVASEAWGAVK